jgi:UDP-N-acetylglucosamine--N-acetylmuramyl-(pentapeptide) pyrophosphoryl-undecaprenol N-acetylglucosamine transferase
VQNPRRALGLVLRDRPSLVVTSGAGFAVPYCVAARALGARLLVVETMARVDDASKAGRVLAPLADGVFVQWPELQAVHRSAVVCRPALLDAIATAPAGEGRGTFVALGSHTAPFDHARDVVTSAVRAGLLEPPVVAQTGHTEWPDGSVDARPWMTTAEMDEGIRGARHVVVHAGAGVIARALRAGRRPLIVPRRRERGEHVDDHQMQISDKLEALGLAVHVRGEIRGGDVERAQAPLEVPKDWEGMPRLGAAVAEAMGRLRP